MIKLLIALILSSLLIDNTSYGEKAEERMIDTYWEVYDIAIPLIQRYEGLRLKAYHDHGGCSIGFGTRAKNCDEVISRKDADARLAYIVRDLVKKVKKDFPNLKPEGQSALVSFRFNCEKGYQDVKKNGIDRHKLWCKKAGGVKLEGLVKRRMEEWKMITGN